MQRFSWLRWVRSLVTTKKRPIRKNGRLPRLESLEVRETPATFTWTGNGTNSNWSTGANWAGGSAPTGAVDELLFPAGASRLSNVNDLVGASFDKITIAGSGYTLGGNAVTLAGGLGSIIQSDTATNATINFDIHLGTVNPNQPFSIGTNSPVVLTFNGQLSGGDPNSLFNVGLAKTGPGMLVFTGDNSAFFGQISVVQGTLRVSNSNALGSSGSGNVEQDGTTVFFGAQLQLASGAGNLSEDIRLSGHGFNDGALLAFSGSHTLSGRIELDNNVTFGGNAGTTINVQGEISDRSTGFNVIKEGAGRLIFSAANSYRGTTTIQHGILTVRDAHALGTTDGTSLTGTFVNQSLNKSGTLQIDPGLGALIIENEWLVLNGSGFNNQGALYNVTGDNVWTGNVVLNSVGTSNTVRLQVEEDTSLTIGSGIPFGVSGNGIVSGGNAVSLTKDGSGTLILTSNNTYGGITNLTEGVIRISDSGALGGTTNGTFVSDGATLQLAVDTLADSIPANGFNRLRIAENITITGTGIDSRGALQSLTGINTWVGTITINGSAGIGVDPDPNQVGDPSYFTSEYSLTLNRPGGTLIGNLNSRLIKQGTGHLIVPTANDNFNGNVTIETGWVTIQNNESFGSVPSNTSVNNRRTITVARGAALHLKPLNAGQSLTIDQNVSIAGTGIDHPFEKINQQGAIESLNGINTLTGNVIMAGASGIGAVLLDPSDFAAGQLFITGHLLEAPPSNAVGGNASGGFSENARIFNVGSTTGTLVLNAFVHGAEDHVRIYLGPRDSGSSQLLYDSDPNYVGVNPGPYNGPINQHGAQITIDFTETDATITVVSIRDPRSRQFGTGWFGQGTTYSITYPIVSATQLEIVINEGGQPPIVGGRPNNTQWNYNGTVSGTANLGQLIKLGDQLVVVQADGVYSGGVEVREGVLVAQNDTALGTGGTVTVQEGATLALGTTIARFNGGRQSGLQIYNTNLVLNGVEGNTSLLVPVPGSGPNFQQTATAPLPQFMILTNSNLIRGVGATPNADDIIPADYLWRGGWSLNTHTPIVVPAGTRLTHNGTIDDGSNTDANGSDLIKVGAGELRLLGANTYKGTTYVGTTNDVASNVAVNNWLNGGAAMPGGILTVANNQALGASTNGTIVQAGSALHLEGNLTITNETLTIAGAGVASSATPTNPAMQGWHQVGPASVINGPTLAPPQSTSIDLSSSGDELEFATLIDVGNGGILQLEFDTYIIPDDIAIYYGPRGTPGSTLLYRSTPGTYVNGDSSTQIGATQITITFNQVTATTVVLGLGGASGFAPGGTVNYGPISATQLEIVVNEGNQSGFTIWDINNGTFISNAVVASTTTSGRVTGVTTDPSDPQTIYITTAGGGAWKTVNNGLTWLPLSDNVANLPLNVGRIYQYGLSLNNNHYIMATGEANNSPDSQAGNGLWQTFDGGQTWQRFAGPSLGTGQTVDGFEGLVISEILFAGGNMYVATSSIATNALTSTGNVGVWRWNGSSWFKLTSSISAIRSIGGGGPGTVGPDDHFGIVFPSANASVTWSDLAFANGQLYAALGVANGHPSNGVYRLANPTATTDLRWYVGDGATDSQNSGGFPVVGNFFSNIKIAANGLNIYAIAASSIDQNVHSVWFSDDGGANWAQQTNPVGTALVGTPPTPITVDFFQGTGHYAADLLLVNGTHLYVAGRNGVQVSIDNGATWTDLTIDAARNAPASNVHTLWRHGNRIFAGTDGGIFVLDGGNQLPSPTNPGTWSSLNANLATSLINSVATHPSDPRILYSGSQSGGIARSIDSLPWITTLGTLEYQPYGSKVIADPSNPEILYAYSTLGPISNAGIGAGSVGGRLYKSIDGGQTWQTTPITTTFLNGSLAIDHILPNRLVAGNGAPNSTQQSFNGGVNFQTLGASGSASRAIALATYQGPFTFDPNFGSVTDQGANSYDGNTVVVLSGSTISLTKNAGNTWVDRSAPGGNFTDLIIDPRNRDHWYVTRDALSNQIYETFDAGRTWTAVSFNLPAVRVWKVVLDPRDGQLYIGTDRGVYTMVAGNASWTAMNFGMPQVKVVDLDLNTTTNTLTAGTYGRSVYQMFLNKEANNAGSLRVVSGSAIWGGNVILAGNTSIGADGSQAVRGLTTANLNITGVIQDATDGDDWALTKIGGGTLTLSGSNTYGGVTTIANGVIVANNPNALGGSNNGTIVTAGTALQLVNSIIDEPLELYGHGPAGGLNGHFTGALENLANNNVYSGPILLRTDSTIGVNTGSQLTVSGVISDDGIRSLSKELTGTLVLSGANSYDGTTFINQGALRVEHNLALGSSVGGTIVRDGAQIQLATPADGTPLNISTEALSLTGTGISGTGAMLNFSGSNTWSGNILLAANSGFGPTTSPAGVVSFGVRNLADTLTISGQLQEATGFNGNAMRSGISKVGAGILSLTAANSYTGTTYINQGTISIQHGSALGTANNNEIQRVVIQGAPLPNLAVPGDPLPGVFNGQFRLSDGSNQTALLAWNAPATGVGSVQSAVATLLGVPTSAILVERAVVVSNTTAGNFQTMVYSITFQGSLAGTNIPLLFGIGSSGATAVVTAVAEGGIGTLVNPGATLGLDGSNGPVVVNGETLTLTGNGANVAFNVTNRELTANVATLTTAEPHGFRVGQSVTVAGISATFNGNYVITAVTANTFSYARTATNVASGPAAGTVTSSSRGALRNVAGDNLWTGGAVTLGSTTSIGADDGTRLTVNSGVNGPASAELSKLGYGTLVFTEANPNLAGTVMVREGILNIQNSAALGTGASNEVQRITLTGATTGTFQVTFKGFSTGNIPITATALTIQGILEALPSIGVGNVRVTKSGTVVTLTYQGALGGIDQPDLVVGGTGPNRVTTSSGSGASVTTLTQGGLGRTEVLSGATLQLEGDITVTTEPLVLAGPGLDGMGALHNLTGNNTWSAITTASVTNKQLTSNVATLTTAAPHGFTVGQSVTVDGVDATFDGTHQITAVTGSSFSFALVAANVSSQSATGTATVQTSSLTLSANATIGVADEVNRLTLDTAITELNAGTGLTKVGPGILQFAGSATTSGTGSNSYTGTTTVAEGTLELNKQDGAIAIPGQPGAHSGVDVVVGGTGPGDAFLVAMADNQIGDNANVTVNANGTYNLADHVDVIAALKVVEGLVTTGFGSTGDLTVSSLDMTSGILQTGAAGSSVTVSGNGGITATRTAAGPAMVTGDGTFNLGSGNHTINLTAPSEVQQIELLQDNVLDTFTLSYLGNSTNELPFGATAAQVRAALEALPGIGVGNVAVTKDPTADIYTFTFQGALAKRDVDQVIAVPTGLSAALSNTLVDGGPVAELDIYTEITGTGTQSKTGDGRLRINSDNPTLGDIRVLDGDVQVEGSVPLVTLAGTTSPTSGKPSVSGNGTIDRVVSGTTTQVGTIAPGANFGATPYGTLTLDPNSTLTWGANTTLFVNLHNNDSNPSIGTAGIDYDLLVVSSGTLHLNNARIDGTVDANVGIGSTFRIIQMTNGAILQNGTRLTHPFGGDTVFIGGQKFNVTYVYGPDGYVELTRELNTIASVSVTVSPATTQYGQDFVYTATMNPEPGVGVPPGAMLRFRLDLNGMGFVEVDRPVNPTTRQATFNPRTDAGLILDPGTYTVTVSYAGNDAYAGFIGTSVVTNRQLLSNIARLTTATPHGLTVGQTVVVDGVGAPFDGTFTVTNVPNATTFWYARVAANVPSQAASGTATIAAIETIDRGNTTFSISVVPTSPALQTPYEVNVQVLKNVPGGVNAAERPTGTVYLFLDRAVPSTINPTTLATADGVGTIDPVTGQVTIIMPGTTVGTHLINVYYEGDARYKPIASNSSTGRSFTVNKASAGVNVIANPSSPVIFGEAVTYTAVVSPVNTTVTPTGIVTFYAGTTSGMFLGSVNLASASPAPDGSITVSIVSSAAPVGTHTITALYGGDTQFNAQSGTLSPFVVTKGGTTTSLSSSVNPSRPGQAVTFTASVTLDPGLSGNLSGGVVRFFNNTTGALLFTGTLNSNGIVNFTTSFPSGSYNIRADYQGTANLAASSDLITQTVAHLSTTRVTASATTVMPGTGVTFTATVGRGTGVSSTVPFPTGLVFFYDVTDNGETLLNPGGTPINGVGVATYNASGATALSAGIHTIRAEFVSTNPSPNTYAPSMDSVTVAVVLGSSVSLTSDKGNPLSGEDVTFTATITGDPNGTGLATGSVEFFAGNTSLGVVNIPSGSDTVSLTTNALRAPGAIVRAVYSGDNQYASSQFSIQQVVNQAGTSTTITSDLNPSGLGQRVTLTAEVTADFPGGGVPTGTVTFLREALNSPGTFITIGTVALNPSGVATLSLTNLPRGDNTIIARYNGSTAYSNNESAPVVQTVLNAATATIASSKANAVTTDVVTFTARVQPAANTPVGAGPTDGMVEFIIDGVVVATRTLAQNPNNPRVWVATLRTDDIELAGSPLTLGRHTVQVRYLQNGTFGTTVSPVLNQTIKGATTTTVSTSLTPAPRGTPVTFTAAVTQDPSTPPGSPPPTGTVSFLRNGVLMGTATLDPNTGTATLTRNLPVGSWNIRAVYNGDTGHLKSPRSELIVQVVQRIVNRLTAVATPNNPAAFAGFTISAVAIAPGGGIAENYNGVATVSVVRGLGSGTTGTGALAGPVTANFVNGTVQFTGLYITRNGTYRLRVASAGVFIDVFVFVGGSGRQT